MKTVHKGNRLVVEGDNPEFVYYLPVWAIPIFLVAFVYLILTNTW